MFGLLNINKPAGLTSRDVVNQIQRVIRPVKIGHAGTLDPLATGVLVLCLGPATRLIPYVQQQKKLYHGTFLLGLSSDTEDIEGTVTECPPTVPPSRSALDAALPDFVGRIQQRPPAYSALKIAGERAYDLAHRGEKVELPPRPVEIHELQVTRYDYPQLELDIQCGSGTYVRSLGRDLARALGTDAVMSALVRQGIGDFRIHDAISTDTLIDRDAVRSHLLPPVQAVTELASWKLTADQLQRVRAGLTLAESPDGLTGEEVAALDPRAISGHPRSSPGRMGTGAKLCGQQLIIGRQNLQDRQGRLRFKQK